MYSSDLLMPTGVQEKNVPQYHSRKSNYQTKYMCIPLISQDSAKFFSCGRRAGVRESMTFVSLSEETYDKKRGDAI